MNTGAAQALARASWQSAIFAEPLRRDSLAGLQPTFPLAPLQVRVIRNQPFEFIAASLSPFLAYAGFSASFVYSAYDDSLQNPPAADRPDIEIVWLDYSRYALSSDFAEWLRSRLAHVRSLSDAPILIADSSRPGDPTNAMLNAIASDIPGVAICEQSAVADKLGAGFLDSRMTALAGMNLSGAACLEIARMFGLVWIPAAVRPRVKAIAIDLDNTLYAGVLGEDGPHGICLTEAHRELQRVLLQYRENGVFLALVSKNEAEDVLNMFAARPEFPLKFEHFSAQNINWDVKSKALQKIASQLRIGVDAILFVDDNPGELADVASSLPGVQCLYAADPGEAARGLTLYPGLAGAKHTTEDRVRVRDLEAAQLRDRLRDSAADPKEYLRSLGVRLCFEFDPEPQLRRAHELSGKTNQFNTAFLRLSEAAIAQRLRDPRFATVTVALRDKLSDSGVIAAIFCEWRGADLCVNEIVISCRALGRGLETAIVAEAIRGMVERARRTLPVRVCFAFTPGERNGPARTWLETFTGVAASGGSVAFEWSGPPECLAGLEGLISIEWNGSK